MLTAFPLTVQTSGVALPKVTASPELAVAVAVYVGPLMTASPGAVEVKEIVWAAWPTAKL